MSTDRKEIEKFVRGINNHKGARAVIAEHDNGSVDTINVKGFPGLKDREYEPINFAESCRPLLYTMQEGLSPLNYARCEAFKNTISYLLSILVHDSLSKSQKTAMKQALKNMNETLETMLK
jgi:hypothetical protein